VANEQALTVPEPNGFIRYPKPNGLDGARADALHDTPYGKLVLGPQQCGLSFAAFAGTSLAAFELAIFRRVFCLPGVKLTVAHFR